MSHSGEVEVKLGEHVVDDLIHYVQNGHVSDQSMKDFAQQLGNVGNPNISNVVYGNHVRRMERDRNRDNSAEMRDILSDWWTKELHDMTTEDALKKLINIFNTRQLRFQDLAKKLEKYLSPPSPPLAVPAAIGQQAAFSPPGPSLQVTNIYHNLR